MSKSFFLKEFRDDHRMIRDILLEIITELVKENRVKSKDLLLKLDKLAGPHFRFEEDALYPAMIRFFGESFIEKLLTDHDLIIARAMKLYGTLEKEKNFLGVEIPGLINTVRSMLPHVSDCEGLGIMVEKLSENEIDHIQASMEFARQEDLCLSTWSDKMRKRKPLFIS